MHTNKLCVPLQIMIKTKTYKIPLIVGHLLFWTLNYWFVIVASEFEWNGFSYVNGSLAFAYGYGLFFNALLFYIQVFWLFPKIYVSRKRLQFYVLSITVITVISLLETFIDYIMFGIYDIQTDLLVGSLINNFIFHIIYSIAGFYYILKFEYLKSEKIKQQLQEENFKSELKYLRAQLNPHFLFNGINSVYHLIGKDNVLAKDTLHQFSGLLRYQLYETNSHITLEKELDYVSQYIKIEETRKGTDIRLRYTISYKNGTKKIAPLLLISFIENAFKHCSNHEEGHLNTISIDIIEVSGRITLKVCNSFDANVATITGGIGLTNVQRRLDLLYKDDYTLDITQEKSIFKVHLVINL